MRWSGSFLAVVAALYVTPAFADSASCAASAEQGQKARAQGKLIEAHRSFLACSASECPGVVAKDCTTWASEVLAATPTIVIDAKDPSGRDVGDATLTIDGNVIARQLDGKAVPVDIGSHTIDVSRGDKHVAQTLIAKEGEKARRLAFVVPTPAADPVRTEEPSSGGHTPFPWIVVGVGGAMIVTGVLLHLTAGAYPRGCDPDSSKCARTPEDGPPPSGGSDPLIQERSSDAGSIHGLRIAGTMSIIAGAPLVIGGLIWHFLEKPAPRTAIAPWYNVSSGGLMMQSKF